MLDSRTLSISIDRPWHEIYERIWRPEDFPKWASGLSQSGLRRDGDGWRADGPEGPIRIRFTDHNPLGVMDHVVDVGTGPEIRVPMRIVANQAGAEVLFTLFRQPGMSDEKFAADAAWVERDLAALKAFAER